MSNSTSNDWITISVKFKGICAECRKEISEGERALWSRTVKQIKHIACTQHATNEPESVDSLTSDYDSNSSNSDDTLICTNCESEIKFSDAKFCPKCGSVLPRSDDVESSEMQQDTSLPRQMEGISDNDLQEDDRIPISVHELGVKLEGMTEQILKSMGYTTEKRQRLKGKSAASHEIDIVAKRSNSILAVECKNYSRYVGIDEIRDFQSKLEDLHLSNALFVTNAVFSQDAEIYAHHKNIKLWDGKQLREHFFSMTVGRLGSVQEIELNLALPIATTYAEATKIELENASSVKLVRPRLLMHPYYKFDYSLDISRKNPARGYHRVRDQGTYIVDALDGEILNVSKSAAAKIASKLFSSSEESTITREQKQIVKDLLKITPIPHYKVKQTKDYDVTKLRYEVSYKTGMKTVIQQVIEDNTKEVIYRLRVSRDRVVTKRMPIIPKYHEVNIRRLSVIYVPKWMIEIEANAANYTRKILAASKTMLIDNIAVCPKHFAVGKIQFSKKPTYAVCELCGRSFCKDHIKRINHLFYCDEHNPEKPLMQGDLRKIRKGIGSLFRRQNADSNAG